MLILAPCNPRTISCTIWTDTECSCFNNEIDIQQDLGNDSDTLLTTSISWK